MEYPWYIPIIYLFYTICSILVYPGLGTRQANHLSSSWHASGQLCWSWHASGQLEDYWGITASFLGTRKSAPSEYNLSPPSSLRRAQRDFFFKKSTLENEFHTLKTSWKLTQFSAENWRRIAERARALAAAITSDTLQFIAGDARERERERERERDRETESERERQRQSGRGRDRDRDREKRYIKLYLCPTCNALQELQ